MTATPAAAIDAVADILRASSSLLFITGAGLSADSGLPTYRGVGGLYDAAGTEEGVSIEDALSGEMMQRRPALTWKYLLQIAEACRGRTFNRGHAVIAEIERHFERVWVLTQNVDGFHRAAGSRNVIDIHGDLHELICTACDYRRRTTNEAPPDAVPPACPACGSLVRPDVVLFGEMLPIRKVARLEQELAVGFDAVFSIGTSSLFPYIAEPMIRAARSGRPTIEINPAETEVSPIATIRLPQGAAETLDAVWEACRR